MREAIWVLPLIILFCNAVLGADLVRDPQKETERASLT